MPIQIKRRSGRKLVTLPNGETAPVRPWDMTPTPLQLALARGHRWLGMLESGEAKSLKEIAAREGIDKANLSRTVRELAEAQVIRREVGRFGHTLSINKDWSTWGLSFQQRLSIQQPPVVDSTTAEVVNSTTPGVANSTTTKDNPSKDNHQKKTPKDKTPCAPVERGEGAGNGRAGRKGRATTPLNATQAALFDRFYTAYPRKKSRITAEKAWARLDPTPELLDTMLAALERAQGTDQWRRGMIPHPATWLNAGGWMDDVATEYTADELAVIAEFNHVLGDIAGSIDPSVYVESRAHAIRDLLARRPHDPDYWRRYFPWVRANVDLPPHTGFDWLISREGFTKVTSGQHNKA